VVAGYPDYEFSGASGAGGTLTATAATSTSGPGGGGSAPCPVACQSPLVCIDGECRSTAVWAVAIDHNPVDAIASLAVGRLTGTVYTVGGNPAPGQGGFFRRLEATDGATLGVDVVAEGPGDSLLTGVSDWDDGVTESAFVVGRVNGQVTFGGELELTIAEDALCVRFDQDGEPGDITQGGGQSNQGPVAVTRIPGSTEVVAAGDFDGSIDFSFYAASEGEVDVFLVTIDSACAVTSLDAIGGPGSERVHGLTVLDSGDPVVLGTTTQTFQLDPITVPPGVFLASRGSGGEPRWALAWGSVTTQPRGLAHAFDDTLVTTGAFKDTIVLGADRHDAPIGTGAYLAKIDSAGVILWSRSFVGDGAAVLPHAVAVAADGSIFVVGALQGSVDFGGGPLSSVGDAENLFIASFTANGSHRFSQRFGSGTARGLAVSPTSDGFVIGGEFVGSLDVGAPQVLRSVAGSDAFVARLAL
jgi:hypothetical protein